MTANVEIEPRRCPSGSAAEVLWPSTRPARELAEGVMHIWLARLDHEAANLELNESELARAQQMLSPLRAARWRRARVALRRVLAHYLEVPAHTVELTDRPRPALAGGRTPVFSLAHCADAAIFAVAAGGAIGVDLELRARRTRPTGPGLWRRLSGEARALQLGALPTHEAELELLRDWVAREAWLKATCGGAPGWLAHIELGPGLVAALAASRAPETISCWWL